MREGRGEMGRGVGADGRGDGGEGEREEVPSNMHYTSPPAQHRLTLLWSHGNAEDLGNIFFICVHVLI